MALKGNLLYNGDFERGGIDGWINGAFGNLAECQLYVTGEEKYRGSYGGKLYATDDFAQSTVAYDKTCCFEEYEAYLFIMYYKLQGDGMLSGRLFGLDDKGNLIQQFYLGRDDEASGWRAIKAILRGFGDITHFQVGLWCYLLNQGDVLYFDEAKLIPLRSVRGHMLADYRWFNGLTSNKTWYSGLGCIGSCRLRSIVRTANVSGTDPTLDIKLTIALFDNISTVYTLQHSQFTGEDFEEKVISLPEASIIKVEYTLGGTDPSFDVHHHLRIEPDADVSGGGLTVY